MEALKAVLGREGVNDREVLRGVEEDRGKMKFHMACNRVFEHVHQNEIKKAKDLGVEISKETITHPNEYFKRSFLLRSLDKKKDVAAEE